MNNIGDFDPQNKATENEILISVRNIGKMYQLFDKPIDRLNHTLFWRFGKKFGREFWALRDVSFDLHRGEAIGILGKNGSGKSTLLQIVAGVLQPTVGEIMVKGRVSALLELGSGFNPEYTGRQNVFMSGAILGLSKEEMESKFDDIAAFADIDDFIDQPVKLYSSGMFARLAFSVAISVDPDILVVDEILSVGDYSFQQKCISRMRQMRDNGLTLLYVSHSSDSIKDVCDKGLFLNSGQPMYWGKAEEAANHYLRFVRLDENSKKSDELPTKSFRKLETVVNNQLRYGNGLAQVGKVMVQNDLGEESSFQYGDSITVVIQFVSFVDTLNFSVSFMVRDNNGIDVTGTTTFDDHYHFPSIYSGDKYQVKFRFRCCLHHGNYGISVALNEVTQRDYSDNILFDHLDACASFQVQHNPDRPIWYKVYLPVDITVEKIENGNGNN